LNGVENAPIDVAPRNSLPPSHSFALWTIIGILALFTFFLFIGNFYLFFGLGNELGDLRNRQMKLFEL